MEDLVDVEVPTASELIEPGSTTSVSVDRFSVQRTSDDIIVEPVLANRPVIVRPRKALYVEGLETSTLYVSTPLWIRIRLGETRVLTEIPSIRPSDSWFGPNTREGELCYSSITEGRTRMEEIPFRAHRAITPGVPVCSQLKARRTTRFHRSTWFTRTACSSSAASRRARALPT